jgi:hypothetical protein
MPNVTLYNVIEALTMANGESRAYLDVENDKVVFLTDEIESQVQQPEEEAGMPEWQRELIEEARAILQDTSNQRYKSLPSQSQMYEWQMMSDFVDCLEDDGHSEILREALRGKGAFRRFGETVKRLAIEKRWFNYRDAAYRRRAIEWCEENGLQWKE